MPEIATATLGVWVGVGSRHEEPHEHGLSHLIEHMAFKGTARRSARAIAEDIENVGGDINAATSVEYTSYTGPRSRREYRRRPRRAGDILHPFGVR
jgi:predicted Zn-dependent peptidase